MCATILELRGSLSRYQSLTGLWRPTEASRTLGNLRKAIEEPHRIPRKKSSCLLRRKKIRRSEELRRRYRRDAGLIYRHLKPLNKGYGDRSYRKQKRKT
jgi:hypothetical protein